MMDYYINPASFSSVFTVPSAVADSHLKFSSGDHIKVLLFLLRNMSEELSDEDISSACNLSLYDVKEALLYWADCGIIVPKSTGIKAEAKEKQTVAQNKKPTRADVARRGNADSKIRYLLRETQLKLGRDLKSNEASTLVWLYDDQGLDVSLILLIVQYAAVNNKLNMRFIESTAVDWINRGICDMAAADEELKKMAVCEQSWNAVCKAFGIERRKPSSKESELSYKWVEEWKMSGEMLVKAYEECVDKKSRFSFPYVAKIIESWHEKGYTSPADTETEKKSGSSPSYDMDLFEKMLHSKD